MNYFKSISILLLLSNLFSNELLFLENSGFLFQSEVMGDMEAIYNNETEEFDRKGLNLNKLNFSLYIKGNHRIDFKYYKNYDPYQGFNLPFVSEYFGFGTQHFFKNKTSLKLNFTFSLDYMFEREDRFNRYRLGVGVSKENDSKDFLSYTQIMLFLQDENYTNKLKIVLRFDYPIFMQVLPENNIPSKVFYAITPSLILDDKDIYYSLAFSICRNFK